jgi:hypothetical protein
MPADEQLERRLVALRDESFQQLGIPDLDCFLPARDVAEMAEDTSQLTGGHDKPSVPRTSCSHYLFPSER